MFYFIGIGSNERPCERLEWARRRLRGLFPDIRFSAEEKTAPLFLHRRDPFANQVAAFSSALSPDEVRSLLKRLETEAGRRPEDKEREIVKLDIDLLACDGTVCKPADWERDYVRRGVRSLTSSERF